MMDPSFLLVGMVVFGLVVLVIVAAGGHDESGACSRLDDYLRSESCDDVWDYETRVIRTPGALDLEDTWTSGGSDWQGSPSSNDSDLINDPAWAFLDFNIYHTSFYSDQSDSDSSGTGIDCGSSFDGSFGSSFDDSFSSPFDDSFSSSFDDSFGSSFDDSFDSSWDSFSDDW